MFITPVRCRLFSLAVMLISLSCVAITRADIPATTSAPAPSNRHVVVVVMDGLRPDSITEQDMPTLYRLSHEGVLFTRHHPVYLSSTEVNGTAIATGAYPRNSGIMANREYRPDIELIKPIDTQSEPAIRKGDLQSKGQYLRLPTVAEIVEASGQSAIIAGTKPVALLLMRSPQADAQHSPVTLYGGNILPISQQIPMKADQQPFPKAADATKSPNAQQDAWTTRILINRLWAGNIPNLTMLWLSEPDYSQHGSGPGSTTALAALRSSDDNLTAVLGAIDAAKQTDNTDILVVSDHGFSTIRRSFDVIGELKKAQFNAVDKMSEKPAGDEVLVVSEGGSVCFYIPSQNKDLLARVVNYLETTDYAGVIFTRKGLPGTFDLKQVWIDTAAAPDIVLSMRWSGEKSATGLPGLIDSYGRRPGQGNHCSLCRTDMHNTLVAFGPDFKKFFEDKLASGNSDIAPTVLALLGLKPSPGMDGRILTEAFQSTPASAPLPYHNSHTIELTRNLGGQMWRQYLKISYVGAAFYLDEGNCGHDNP